MESTLPQVISASGLVPGNGSGAPPFAQQTVVLTKQDYIQLKWEANYWRGQYERAVEREVALKQELEAREAMIRDLKQRLYGRKSEKAAGQDETGEGKPGSARKRGQQQGSRGHGRRNRSGLPVVEELHDLPEADKYCPRCGEAFLAFPGREESDIVEVQVQAHRRRICRQRYQKGCQCPTVPGIISAPAAPRLLPKSPLGVSVWTEVLLDKYLSGRPTHRLCEAFQHHGLPLAQGTLTDGMRRLVPLFEPVVQALQEQQCGEALFHGDETRWEVFEEVEGKVGHRWYLWVIRSVSVVFYQMAPGRGAETPTAHFAGLDPVLAEVVLVCDRYSAYKCLANSHAVLILAFCWVHVRRDFIDAARAWPELTEWMFDWVEDIRELYRLNAARLEVWDNTLAFDQQPLVFVEHHRALTAYLERMKVRCEAYLQAEALHSAKRKVLTSLRNHWAGLTVFVTRPAVAMDNNSAERALRPPVIGRKNYYGSGSVWSARLAAAMFSVLQTVLLWGLNPHHWLSAFLQACADHGGQPPVDLAAFLPWAMTDARKQQLAQPLPVKYPWFGTSSPSLAPEPADTS